MNKQLILFIALILFGTVGVTKRAEAAEHQFTVINNGATPICHLYISPSDSTQWGDDWLGEEIIRMGELFVTFVEEDTYYDILALACDGFELGQINQILLYEDVTWTLEVNNGEDRDRDGVPNSADVCPYEPEIYNDIFDDDGCPDNVTTLIDLYQADIDAFWAQEWSSVQQIAQVALPYLSPTAVSVYLSDSYSADEYNAFYRGSDHTIQYDFYFINDAVTDFGDAAAVMMLAHEFGHLVQANLQMLANRPSVEIELQADCLSGAYFHFADLQGYLEEGDLEEAIRFAYFIGTEEEGTHGTHEQRAAMFSAGFERGIGSCFGDA